MLDTQWSIFNIMIPDHFKNSICNDEHFPCDFSPTADHITGSKYGRSHFEYEIVQELGLALFEDAHLLEEEEYRIRLDC